MDRFGLLTWTCRRISGAEIGALENRILFGSGRLPISSANASGGKATTVTVSIDYGSKRRIAILKLFPDGRHSGRP